MIYFIVVPVAVLMLAGAYMIGFEDGKTDEKLFGGEHKKK